MMTTKIVIVIVILAIAHSLAACSGALHVELSICYHNAQTVHTPINLNHKKTKGENKFIPGSQIAQGLLKQSHTEIRAL